jgi:hypothetical protein
MDISFNAFQEALYKEGVDYGIATDWAVLALDAAGTLVGGAGTKAALAATSGGLTGAKAAFDKNVYFDKTIPAVLAKMVATRKEILVKLRGGLTRTTEEYSLTQALVDLEDYYYAGTIPGAIIGIAETAGAEAEKADRDLKNLLSAEFGEDKNTELLTQFVEWDGEKYNDQTRNKLDQWISKNVPGSPSFPTFASGMEYRYSRSRAVFHLVGSLPAKDDNSRLLEEFLGWDGEKYDAENLKKLREWMASNELTKVTVLHFLGLEEHAEKRKKAVSELKL